MASTDWLAGILAPPPYLSAFARMDAVLFSHERWEHGLRIDVELLLWLYLIVAFDLTASSSIRSIIFIVCIRIFIELKRPADRLIITIVIGGHITFESDPWVCCLSTLLPITSSLASSLLLLFSTLCFVRLVSNLRGTRYSTLLSSSRLSTRSTRSLSTFTDYHIDRSTTPSPRASTTPSTTIHPTISTLIRVIIS